MNREQAIEKASAFITKKGYRHGKCLSSRINPKYPKETWVVEFAYDGLEERCPTKDPGSIILEVEGESGKVWKISIM